MAKNVLILSSSPRRGGNSDLLCDEFARGAAEAGNDVEKVFLGDKVVGYCTGCSMCSLHNKPCPQQDDASGIIGRMLAADVIVLATPIYFYAMSGQLKTFLDRCCGAYGEMRGKEFYFIAAGAESGEDLQNLVRVFDNLMGFVDCLEEPRVKGRVLASGVWHVGEVKGSPAMAEAYEMGKNV